MNLPKINLESEGKLYLSIGMVFFVIAGLIFTYYIANFYSESIKTVLLTYFLIFGVGGLITFTYGILKFIKEESEKGKYGDLIKKEKEIEIDYKQMLLDEKIEKLRKKSKTEKEIKLLEDTKEIYNKQRNFFAHMTSGTAVATGSSLLGAMFCECGRLMYKGKDGYYCTGCNRRQKFIGPLDFIQ